MTYAKVGDVIRWRRAFNYDIVPPAYVLCTYAGSQSSGGVIVDRGGLDSATAVAGDIAWVGSLSAGDRLAEVVPEDEAPDYIWAKIAIAQMRGHGEKSSEGDTQ